MWEAFSQLLLMLCKFEALFYSPSTFDKNLTLRAERG